MGEDDAPLYGGAFEYFDVRPANQLFIPCGSKVETSCAQTGDNVGSDVFVGQQRMFSSASSGKSSGVTP